MQYTTKFRKATRIVLSCLMLSVLLLSCKSEVKDVIQDKIEEDSLGKDLTLEKGNIFGKWKLFEYTEYVYQGSSSFTKQINKIENGHLFEFNQDFSFKSTESGFHNCDILPYVGTFSLDETEYKNIVTVKINDCSFVREFSYGFENENLILMLPGCDEGCYYKLKTWNENKNN